MTTKVAAKTNGKEHLKWTGKPWGIVENRIPVLFWCILFQWCKECWSNPWAY